MSGGCRSLAFLPKASTKESCSSGSNLFPSILISFNFLCRSLSQFFGFLFPDKTPATLMFFPFSALNVLSSGEWTLCPIVSFVGSGPKISLSAPTNSSSAALWYFCGQVVLLSKLNSSIQSLRYFFRALILSLFFFSIFSSSLRASSMLS